MKPKKSLGQNFLKDSGVLAKIIKSANLSMDDFVVEIGSGDGVLTEELVKYAGRVVAVEIDRTLAKELDSRLRGNDKVKIINGDILKINLPEVIRSLHHPVFGHPLPKVERDIEASSSIPLDPRISGKTNLNSTRKNINSDLPEIKVRARTPEPAKQLLVGTGFKPVPTGNIQYKVIANIPYYITSPIIQLFLETNYPPKEMILMVQKEVAERICANPGAMSILAVSVQYYARPELLFYVDKKAFWPVPEVDSAVIRITPLPSPVPKGEGETERKKFFRIVKAGFSAKRKMLVNNLANSLHINKKIIEDKLKKTGIEPSVRPQELSIDDWKCLVSVL